MAFRDSNSCQSGSMPSFYNLDMAVGPDCPNRRDDVMLVQFLLKQFYAAPDRVADAPRGEMKVDGWWGGTTARWILAFQQRLKKKGLSICVDGQVDPALSESGSISHTVYTIRWLNGQWYGDLDSVHQNNHWNHLEEAVDAPSTLQAAVGPPGDDWVDPKRGF